MLGQASITARVAVKICGVTDPGSALLSAELGADFLGLNFWPGSPRYISLERAREIAAAVRRAAPRVALVGVFVNPAAELVEETAAAVGLDLLQFSGNEPAAAVRPFAARAIKALRTHDLSAAEAFADCWGLLFDAPRGGAAPGARTADSELAAPLAQDYGGTGRQWDYAAAAPVLAWAAGPAGSAGPAGDTGLSGVAAAAGTAGPAGPGHRVFLAGGIRPDNVRRVIATLRPFAVDVCSGVEAAPGRKDPRLLRQLFEEVGNGEVDGPT
jgi:phosphoribosylanthranilate isomerase